VPNPHTELRHDAARECIRGALRMLWPAQGPRATACRTFLEQALAVLEEAGPPHPPETPTGPATPPTPVKGSKPRRRRISLADTVPFPEGWDRHADR
jgi:hypothetical protein